MKRKIFVSLSLIICTVLAVSAQKRIQLDSETTTTTYDFSGYDTIEVSGDFKVDLTVDSSSNSFTLEANRNLMEYVDITQEGKTLKLDLKNLWNARGKMILDATISTTGMVDTYWLSGDAVVNVSNALKADAISLNLKGDSVLKADIDANDLNLQAKSDSAITLSGSVTTLDARLSSDSLLKGKELTISNADINLSGDSQAWIVATSSLSAVASGDSVLRYSGNPEVKKSVSTGDSEIYKVN